MLILAIDTTGLFSSLSLVENGNKVLYLKRQSVAVPGKNWRDFPYVLPQKHKKFILSEVGNCFKTCRISWQDIDAIAVSAGSGIYSCVVAGEAIASTWSEIFKKPLIRVDHILAHIYSTWLENDIERFNFPILVFSASGSHSDFSLIKSRSEMRILFNETPEEQDGVLTYFIGVGKYFYRMANMLLPEKEKADWKNIFPYINKGNHSKYDMTGYYYNADDLYKETIDKELHNITDAIYKKAEKMNMNDFSNNKTIATALSCLYSARERKDKARGIALKFSISNEGGQQGRSLLFNFDFSDLMYGLEKIKQDLATDKGSLTNNDIADLSASFQHSVSELLINKILLLIKLFKVKEVHIAGGISANEYLEKRLRKKVKTKVRYPQKLNFKYDNAAMIGCLAYYQKFNRIKFKNFKPKITK